ncbi:MAG: TIR domain-containing protein [Chitinophagales bacterium]
MSNKKHIFISYAAEDEKHKLALDKHLSALKRQGIIQSFDAAKIKAHQDYNQKLQQNLEKADIILLLLSADALADDYIHDTQIEKALQRAESKTAVIMPILVRAVDYEGLDLDKYAVLPSNKKAITSWNNQDKAYEHIAHQIRKVAENLDDFKIGKAHVFEQILVNDTINPAPKDDNINKKTALGIGIFSFAMLLLIAFAFRDTIFPDTMKTLNEPFDVTVFVHGENGKQDMVLRQKGNIIMDFSGERRPVPIDANGKAIFHNIAANKAGHTILLDIDFSEAYRPIITDSPYVLQPNTDIYLQVALQNLDKIEGTVFDGETEEPLENVSVSIGKLETFTLKNGFYELQIPKEKQREKQNVTFAKDGFKTEVKSVHTQDNEPIKIVMERK